MLPRERAVLKLATDLVVITTSDTGDAFVISL